MKTLAFGLIGAAVLAGALAGLMVAAVRYACESAGAGHQPYPEGEDS